MNRIGHTCSASLSRASVAIHCILLRFSLVPLFYLASPLNYRDSSYVSRRAASISNPIWMCNINSYNLSRTAIAIIWLYHGLIPKLLFTHTTELELVQKGLIVGTPEMTVLIAGVVEVIIGLSVVVFWNSERPIYISLFGFTLLLMGAVALSPEYATHAFNPITLTLSAIFFCLIQLVESTLRRESGGKQTKREATAS